MRLFQHLGGWAGAPNPIGIQSRSKAVLQRAYQVLYHLEQCEKLARTAKSQFHSHTKSIENLPHALHGWSPLVAGLIIELSGAMTVLRILQNDVWQLTTTVTGVRNAPPSMRDASKDISKKYPNGNQRPRWLTEMPLEVRELITTYWRCSGELVAAYRDVGQHFDVTARGGFVFTDGNSVTKVSVLLPDNPELKSRKKFTYENSVDGLELASTAFATLHDLVENLAKFYQVSPAPLMQPMEFAPAIQHKSGVAQITALMLYDNDGRNGAIIGQDEETAVTYMQTTI